MLLARRTPRITATTTSTNATKPTPPITRSSVSQLYANTYPAVATATSDYFSGAPIGQIFGDSAANVRRTPISPYDTQIQQAFTTALTNVETKGQDPDEAFDEAVASANEAIGG